MRLFGLSAAAFCMAPMVAAQGLSPECQALYDDIVADVPTDLSQCTPQFPDYTISECTPPHSYGGTVATSHLILAIDASGSMAGQIGGRSKMAIAQQEALAFLSDIDESVNVGLVVYGHLGNNQAEGKAESCGSAELIHGFDAPRSALEETIEGLRPVGWTPIGGALEFSADIINDLPEPQASDEITPVIYLISDGEETCEGSPVDVASDLYEGGIRTTVNTIGFAVDAETQTQLEAIAEAGGGRYFSAETGQRLREHFAAIAAAERSSRKYEECVVRNANRIFLEFSRVSSESVRCYNRNRPTDLVHAVLRAERAAGPDDARISQCNLVIHANGEAVAMGNFVGDVIYPFDQEGYRRVEAYYTEMGMPNRRLEGQ